MVIKLRPWLWLPAQLAHGLTPYALKAFSSVYPRQNLNWRPLHWRGLEFRNPIGIAGGVDKNAYNICDWWNLGAGFVEIGTITPRAQKGNPGKTVDRRLQSLSVWNRMGFPNEGLDFAIERIKNLPPQRITPLFANIGKNRETINSQASNDYLKCISQLKGLVDAFVVNISSPNTEGLRELLAPENLGPFLQPLIVAAHEAKNSAATPLLLKLSPDMNDQDLESALNVSADLNIDGWILTNTSASIRNGLPYPETGGVSGQPLAERSKQLLQQAIGILGNKKSDRLLISVGGIMSPQDVFDRLKLGADLVQVYSTLIFHGPSFFKEVAAESKGLKWP